MGTHRKKHKNRFKFKGGTDPHEFELQQLAENARLPKAGPTSIKPMKGVLTKIRNKFPGRKKRLVIPSDFS